MTIRERISTTFLLGTTVSLLSCGAAGDGTQTGSKCTEIELRGLCPAGTAPNLDAAATAECDTAGSGSGSQSAAGNVSGSADFNQVCRSSGTCRVLCEVTVECPFGVKTITATEVVCATKEESNSCGDGICLGEEDHQSCPADCERECDANATSCDGAQLRTCSPKGLWSVTDCEPGTQCKVENGAATCATLAAVCMPQETQCAGDAVRTCTNAGQWGEAAPCPSGQTCDPSTSSCVGACQPGSSSCNGSGLRTCSPQGEWVDAECELGTQCTSDSAAASCTPIPAVCEAGTSQCNGDAVQTCNALGQWDTPVGCPADQVCDPTTNDCVSSGVDAACDQFCTSCFVTSSNVALQWIANDGSRVAVNSYDTCVTYVCGDADEATGPWIDCCNQAIGEHSGLCRGDILDMACP